VEVYEHAPITEAALDIRVRFEREIGEADMLQARDDDYSDLFQRPTTVEVRFEANPEKRSSSATALNASFGYSYRTADRLNVYQVRPDGFTHNRLAPYQEWSLFAAEAKRLWTNYRDTMRPAFIELLGLNYINDIEVPLGSRIEDYFKTFIEVPASLPQVLNTFSMGYQLTIPEDAGFLKIGQTYGIPKREGFGVIRLNIQAFKQINFQVGVDDEATIWKSFESLRMAKTEAFEACITEKVREMIR
jgi:uncharacterized protein (TIGR04255 family)